MKFRFAMGIICCFIFINSAFADRWAPFATQRFVSANKKYEILVNENLHARLFEVGKICQFKQEFSVPILPRQGFLTDDGEGFVIVDRYGGNDGETPGFLLMRGGKEIHRVPIKDLVNVSKASRSISSIQWQDGLIGFSSNKIFVLTTVENRQWSFSIETGQPVIQGKPAKTVLQQPSGDEEQLNKVDFLRQFKVPQNLLATLEEFPEKQRFTPRFATHLILHHPDETWECSLWGKIMQGGNLVNIPVHMKISNFEVTSDFEPLIDSPTKMVEVCMDSLKREALEFNKLGKWTSAESKTEIRAGEKPWVKVEEGVWKINIKIARGEFCYQAGLFARFQNNTLQKYRAGLQDILLFLALLEKEGTLEKRKAEGKITDLDSIMILVDEMEIGTGIDMSWTEPGLAHGKSANESLAARISYDISNKRIKKISLPEDYIK